jgi:Tfp pilus assembly protein PilF
VAAVDVHFLHDTVKTATKKWARRFARMTRNLLEQNGRYFLNDFDLKQQGVSDFSAVVHTFYDSIGEDKGAIFMRRDTFDALTPSAKAICTRKGLAVIIPKILNGEPVHQGPQIYMFLEQVGLVDEILWRRSGFIDKSEYQHQKEGSTMSGNEGAEKEGETEGEAGYFRQLVVVLEQRQKGLVDGTERAEVTKLLAGAKVSFALALKSLYQQLSAQHASTSASALSAAEQQKLQEKGQWVRLEVVRQYRSALEMQPSMADVHAQLGLVLTALHGDTAGAMASYKRAIELKPDHIDAHSNLGVAFHTLAGSADAGTAPMFLQEAAESYSSAIAIAPSKAVPAIINAKFNLGAVLFAQRRAVDARAAFQQVLDLDPAHTSAAGALAQLDAAIAAASAAAASQQGH